MSDNPRDTQFAGFARLLEEDIGKVYDRIDIDKEGHIALTQAVQLIIARRAYDLVAHALNLEDDFSWYKATKCKSMAKLIQLYVSDMTEWPHD